MHFAGQLSMMINTIESGLAVGICPPKRSGKRLQGQATGLRHAVGRPSSRETCFVADV